VIKAKFDFMKCTTRDVKEQSNFIFVKSTIAKWHPESF